MIPFKEENQHTILELLYKKRHKQRNYAVDNAPKILKKTLRDFLTKFDLHVFFCVLCFQCLLHNLLQSQTKTNVERLMRIIQVES
jgi:hypothetical protein